MTTSLTQAKMLCRKIRNALHEMSFSEDIYSESEILFRLKTIEGFLIIAQNDATKLLELWESAGS